MSKLFKTKNFMKLIYYLILITSFIIPVFAQSDGDVIGQAITVGIFLLILFIGSTFSPVFIYIFLRMLLKTSIRRAIFYAIISSIIFLLIVILFAIMLEP